MGGPKALIGPLATQNRTPLARVCEWVHDAGCASVIAVIGAEADAVREALGRDPWPTSGPMGAAPARPAPVPGWLHVAEATDWDDGMGASLRRGLRAAAQTDADAVLVTLVDLPDVRTPVYARVLRAARAGSSPILDSGAAPARQPSPDHTRALLARASYAGVPGHPVLIGRHHWDAVAASAVGDRGAREVFARTPHLLIECGHLSTGRDADAPA